MTRAEAILASRAAGQVVFTTALRAALPHRSLRTFEGTRRRLRQAGVLTRAVQGIDVTRWATGLRPGTLLERIAGALRPDHLIYRSLESALIEYGVLAQIMPDRITLMTTGRSGTHTTPWGVIKFTHTARPRAQLEAGLLADPRSGPTGGQADPEGFS